MESGWTGFSGRRTARAENGLAAKVFASEAHQVKRKRPPPGETRLAAGDRLSLYIGDEFFAVPKKIDPFLSKIAPRLNILFENEQIMIVDKRAGMVAHPDAGEKGAYADHLRAGVFI